MDAPEPDSLPPSASASESDASLPPTVATNLRRPSVSMLAAKFSAPALSPRLPPPGGASASTSLPPVAPNRRTSVSELAAQFLARRVSVSDAANASNSNSTADIAAVDIDSSEQQPGLMRRTSVSELAAHFVAKAAATVATAPTAPTASTGIENASPMGTPRRGRTSSQDARLPAAAGDSSNTVSDLTLQFAAAASAASSAPSASAPSAQRQSSLTPVVTPRRRPSYIDKSVDFAVSPSPTTAADETPADVTPADAPAVSSDVAVCAIGDVVIPVEHVGVSAHTRTETTTTTSPENLSVEMDFPSVQSVDSVECLPASASSAAPLRVTATVASSSTSSSSPSSSSSTSSTSSTSDSHSSPGVAAVEAEAVLVEAVSGQVVAGQVVAGLVAGLVAGQGAEAEETALVEAVAAEAVDAFVVKSAVMEEVALNAVVDEVIAGRKAVAEVEVVAAEAVDSVAKAVAVETDSAKEGAREASVAARSVAVEVVAVKAVEPGTIDIAKVKPSKLKTKAVGADAADDSDEAFERLIRAQHGINVSSRRSCSVCAFQ